MINRFVSFPPRSKAFRRVDVRPTDQAKVFPPLVAWLSESVSEWRRLCSRPPPPGKVDSEKDGARGPGEKGEVVEEEKKKRKNEWRKERSLTSPSPSPPRAPSFLTFSPSRLGRERMREWVLNYRVELLQWTCRGERKECWRRPKDGWMQERAAPGSRRRSTALVWLSFFPVVGGVWRSATVGTEGKARGEGGA